MVSPFSSEARPPKYRKTSALPRASGRDWVRMALPVSAATVRASSSTSACSSSAMRETSLPRSRGGVRRQAGNASRAARTARSTSLAPPRGTTPRTVRWAGFSISIVRPSALSTHSPPISILPTVRSTSTAIPLCLLRHLVGQQPHACEPLEVVDDRAVVAGPVALTLGHPQRLRSRRRQRRRKSLLLRRAHEQPHVLVHQLQREAGALGAREDCA